MRMLLQVRRIQLPVLVLHGCCAFIAGVILACAVICVVKIVPYLVGSDEFLGADTIFPLLVMVMVHSSVPNMHLLLQYVHAYGDNDGHGEEGGLLC
jgi:hypothetical protein